MPVKDKKIDFPIFLLLFVLYIIFNGLFEGWFWFGLGAFVVDLIINPIYMKSEVDY